MTPTEYRQRETDRARKEWDDRLAWMAERGTPYDPTISCGPVIPSPYRSFAEQRAAMEAHKKLIRAEEEKWRRGLPTLSPTTP